MVKFLRGGSQLRIIIAGSGVPITRGRPHGTPTSLAQAKDRFEDVLIFRIPQPIGSLRSFADPRERWRRFFLPVIRILVRPLKIIGGALGSNRGPGY